MCSVLEQRRGLAACEARTSSRDDDTLWCLVSLIESSHESEPEAERYACMVGSFTVTLAARSEAPFNLALREIEPILFRFALRATRNPDVSRDLVQDTLVAALTAMPEFAGRLKLRTWVIGILSHKVVDHFRRQNVPESIESADLVASPSSEDLERATIARQTLGKVEEALQKIPARERPRSCWWTWRAWNGTRLVTLWGSRRLICGCCCIAAGTGCAGGWSMLEPACRLVTAHFSDFLDGEPLPLFSLFWVHAHLTFCPRCKRTYRSLTQTREVLRALREPDGAWVKKGRNAGPSGTTHRHAHICRRRSHMKKNPWVAAILNFLLCGGGYLYLGQRMLPALLLTVGGTTVQILEISQSPIFRLPMWNLWPFFLGGLATLKIGLAMDAYTEAKKT